MGVPKRTGLLTLLRESMGSQFVIPVYQRNYTWEANREIKQFLQDLKDVLDGKYKNHFLGIIIYHEKQLDFSSREFSVIDGQQRLTTTFLTLYAAKNLYSKIGDDVQVNNLNGQYLTNPFNNTIKYKLKPLVSDNDVYKCIVEDRIDEITDQSSNIIKNYNYIYNQLSELMSEGYDLNNILLAMDKLNLVVIPLSEDDNAQKIFESINATGVKLTAADLIRNYLLMDLPSDIQDQYYVKYWRELEKNVSQDSKQLEMFFRMYLAIKKYELVSKNSVYREFVSWVEKQAKDVKNICEDLVKYSKIYFKLYSEKVNNINQDIRDSIIDFRKMGHDLSLPLFMEFYALFEKNIIDSKTLASLYLTINSYMIRRSICDLNSQNISRLFPSVLKKISENCDESYKEIIKELNHELVASNINTSGSFMPTNKQMLEMLLNANVYGRPALRTILERIELHNNDAPVDLSQLSIEHLMPQTPTDEWLEELDTDLNTYNDNLHRLGNLTLAAKSDNSKMKNYLWDYKNEILKKTGHLKMNMDLLQVKRWDIESIDERTKTLISKICIVYPYPQIDGYSAKESSTIVSKEEALKLSIQKVVEKDCEVIKKDSIYKHENNSNGYVVSSSKMYTSGKREYYWFAYREGRFDSISNMNNKYLVLSCRDKEVITIKLPKKFMDDHKAGLIATTYEDGSISHYHLSVYVDNNNCSLVVSKPFLKEIDISEYVIA